MSAALRSRAGAGLLVAAALIALAACAGGAGDPPNDPAAVAKDQPWPATQPNLGLEADGFDSWASARAALPAGVVVTPPAAGTPPDIVEYSGLWSGWMCPARNTDLKIAFTQVGPTAATATIAWAMSATSRGSATVRLTLAGDEFRSDGVGALYKFRLRTFDERVGVETMDVMRIPAGGRACAGVLRKDAAS